MKRLALIALAALALAACGLDGDPIPPDGAVTPVDTRGIDLAREGRNI